jgi:glycerol kinase
MTTGAVLALDQGTTSSRALAVTASGEVAAMAQEAFAQIFPQSGWVEHDPEEIWRTQMTTARAVIERLGAGAFSAIGLANQRETVIVWERSTGAPIHNAIVWQDRRTAPETEALARAGWGPMVAERTGLVLDPYFSASKIAFILDAVPGARERAARGELAAGTVDCFLIWRLTGGRVHATDATNASRTSLFDIRKGVWDEELCDLFRVPLSLLPEVRDSAADYGVAEALLPGVRITGVAGDQQAALVGQACFSPGEVKSTYGTGAFLVLNTGDRLIASRSGLLSTIAYRLNGETVYALEGSILSAGSTIQWLRDNLRIIRDGAEAGEMAASIPDTGGVHLAPAFVGLGAPRWDPEARGAILGLQRGTSIAEIARAALESVAFQTAELLAAMAEDGVRPRRLKVDGGMTRNDFLMQFMADILDLEVVRPAMTETTALGAAMLASVGSGAVARLEEAASLWSAERAFHPAMASNERERRLALWTDAVRRISSRL